MNRRLFFASIFVFLLSLPVFSQSDDDLEEPKEPEITVITINNARQTSYKKNEDTGNDSIVLEGSVSLTVQKGQSTNEITADKITYDRKTEMLYAEGNVEVIMKSSASGKDKANANSLLLNTSTLEGVFDGGRVIQTQSDALNLPSGSTLIVFSEVFGKGNESVITFKNSSLTFCDEDPPHWHIDSTRTWLLPGGEFAFFNAILYVGVIPVMYFPAFYYPKDELIFNPVFNYTRREGHSIQTTTYLWGRKPLESSTTTSDSSNVSSDSLRGVFSFIKSDTLKEQVREGLVLHNLDEDYRGDTSHYVKIMADWYSNLGFMAGIDGKLNPWETYISRLDFGFYLGLSNTLFKDSSRAVYHPFSKSGRMYKDSSSFMGIKLPFRYSTNFQFELSKPFRVSLALPVYSDPYYAYDFLNNRHETMDWISYLLDNSQNSTDEISITEVSSYAWTLKTSYSPSLPEFFRPYLTSVTISTESSVNISSKNTEFTYLKDGVRITNYDKNEYEEEWLSYTPNRKFYYPSLITPISASISGGGTLFSWPPYKRSSTKNLPYIISMNKPDELKTEKQLETEKKAAEAERKKKEGLEVEPEEEIKDEEEEENPFTLPELEFAVNKETVDDTIAYKLDYSLGFNIQDQMAYNAANLHTSDDFQWERVRSNMYIIKLPASLSSRFNYGGNFLTVENRFSSTPIFQEHSYISPDAGYTDKEIDNLRLADYKAENRDVINSNSVVLKPFLFFPVISDTSLSWNSSIKLYRRIFTGTASEPKWDDKGIDIGDEECITVNSLAADIRAKEFNDKFIQSLRLEAIMPPLLKKYTATLGLTFPYVSASISTGFEEVKRDAVDVNEKWKKSPLNQSLSVSLFNSKLTFSENYTYNLEDNNHESLKFSASAYGMNFSYTMAYVQGYDFNDGWIIRKEKEFLPYSLSFSYQSPDKTFFKWFNRIAVTPGLSTSIVADLLRPTNSYFIFSPYIKFRVHELFDITFSATTRNSVLYWYFHNEPGDLYSEWGGFPGNIIKDLIDSFRFDNEKLRKNSGFKLKSLNMTISHDLHDWKFNMTMKIEPRLITENGKKYFDFKPYITIGVIWKPMESMKTSIVDNYGEWKLE